MRISATVDTSKLEAAFGILPKSLTKSLLKTVLTGATMIQRSARAKHRFTTRSGMAERSIAVKKINNKLGYVVWLNDKIAPYSPRLHEGGGGKLDSLGRRMTNKPDQFLYEAAAEKGKIVEALIDSAVSGVIKKAGL